MLSEIECIMGKTAKKASNSSATVETTQRALIHSALEVFTSEGVNAVSLRQVVAASGVSNQSAIHYHFKNKLGLISAVLDHINSRLAPFQEEALAELADIAKDGTPTVREIVSIGFAPYIMLFQQSHEDRMCLRFLSRLTWESGEKAQKLMVTKVRPYFNQKIKPYLQQAVPEKSEAEIEFHLYMAASNLIHGLSDITLLDRDPGGIVNELYRSKQELLLRYFINYMTAGLGSYDK